MTTLPTDDRDLTALMRDRLFTAVVGDVLDQMGLRRQFLPFGVSPLDPRHRIAGRAMTVLEADVFDDRADAPGPLSRTPFGLLFKALDDLKAGDIYIANAPSLRYALWGGLMTLRAQKLGAAGAILDGCVRDADEIAKLGFPVFARGVYAQDQGPRGKVIDWRCPLEIGGVRILPGDLIFADREGVLVIPKAAEREALTRALEKVATENKVADAIRAGMSTEQAFATFGVM
jgi:regulator of RNase E activity RraA